MNTDAEHLASASTTERVIRAFHATYNELGYGFLESVYESALAICMADEGLVVERQVPVPVYFRGQAVGDFRIDLLVERDVVVEVKAASSIAREHEAQLLNYLKATDRHVGLLLNFGPRPQFKRMVMGRDPIRVHPCSSVADT
ncbi:MAG: GxxExxY protein [Pseudomonadota bacterium]